MIAPAPDLAEELALQAEELALRIAKELDVVGHLAVELFETRDGRILVNELAMRPHNSGHWTQDGAITSQFANHVRAVLDLPLGDPRPRAKWTVMVNVLGGDYPDMYSAYLHCMARDPQLKIHMYGKDVKPGRKVGHVNTYGDDLDDVLERARHACRLPERDDHRMSTSPESPVVGIVMGSDSDWPVMEAAAQALDEFEIAYEVDVVSAHRMPREMIAYGEEAGGPRPQGDHRGRGRRRPPAGHARLRHPAARHRRARAAEVPRRHGLAAVDRADAGRRAGRHRLGRRRAQRRPARGPHPRPRTTRNSSAGCGSSSRS